MPQFSSMSWQGRALWTNRGRRVASRGLQKALEHTLAKANALVPLEEGTLMRSGKVSVDQLGGAISYDTPYAVRQHEQLDYRHAPGRQAKYLEQPMRTEREEMLRLMAVSLREWLRG